MYFILYKYIYIIYYLQASMKYTPIMEYMLRTPSEKKFQKYMRMLQIRKEAQIGNIVLTFDYDFLTSHPHFLTSLHIF